MSFFDFETGLSALLGGADRRKDDRAVIASKVSAKLRELRAAGVNLELDDEDGAREAKARAAKMEIVAS